MSGFDFKVANWLDWLASVRPKLRDYPESVPGPHGDRVSVGYRNDPVRGEHAILTAFESHPHDPRTLVGATVEVAPGVEVELSDVKVYLLP